MLDPDALTMAMPGFSTQMGKNALTNVNAAKRCVSSWHISRPRLFPPEPAVVTAADDADRQERQFHRAAD
jgi:hypothetical protein